MSKDCNVILTGVPRSGTSHLCRILHDIENCVVLNEPKEVVQFIRRDGTLENLPGFYNYIRNSINEKKPISNKIDEHGLIEDTYRVRADSRSGIYSPEVSGPEFMLATKNTIMYMARINQIRQIMPDATMIASIRNPLDTIASWQTSFAHLKNISIRRLPAGHSRDLVLSAGEREELRQIEAISDLASKRARYWNYLAEKIVTEFGPDHIVRYEDLVASPVQEIKRVLDRIPLAPPYSPKKQILPSAARSSRHVMDEKDFAAVQAICSDVSASLGYDLSS